MPKRKDPKVNPISALLGDRVLVELHGDKYIVTSLQPRRRKKSTKPQKERNQIFKEAVSYARHINKDPKRKAAYKRKAKGYRNVYQAVLSAYLKNPG